MPLLLTYKGNVKEMYAQAEEDTLHSFHSQDSFEQYLFGEPTMKRIRTEMKNNKNNKQGSPFSSYQSKSCSSSQKTKRGPHYKGNNNYNKQQHKTYQVQSKNRIIRKGKF